MYIQENDVKNLILKLQKSFPGCYLACEVVNSFIVKVLKRKMWRKKNTHGYCHLSRFQGDG